MSTADTMFDLEDDLITEDQAIVMCLHYLAMWTPEVKGTEAFDALLKIMREREPEYAEKIFSIQQI